jgi:hypothetical protein
MQKYAFVRRVHLLYLSRESVTIFAVLKRDKGLTPRPGQVSHSGSWILSERHPTGAEQQKGILGCIGGTPASEGSRHGSGEAGTGKQIPGISPPRMKFPLQGSIQPNERSPVPIQIDLGRARGQTNRGENRGGEKPCDEWGRAGGRTWRSEVTRRRGRSPAAAPGTVVVALVSSHSDGAALLCMRGEVFRCWGRGGRRAEGISSWRNYFLTLDLCGPGLLMREKKQTARAISGSEIRNRLKVNNK